MAERQQPVKARVLRHFPSGISMWDINATPEIFQGYSKEHEIFQGYSMERFQGYSNEQGAYRGIEGHLSISSLNFSFVLQAGHFRLTLNCEKNEILVHVKNI